MSELDEAGFLAQLQNLPEQFAKRLQVPLAELRCGTPVRREAAWWKKAGIDSVVSTRALWLKTRPLPTVLDKMGIKGATSVAVVDADE